MKKHKKLIGILVSVLVLIPTFTSVSFADELDSNTQTVLNGSIEWDDNDNSESTRPESVTVDLYEDDVLIDSRATSEADSWQFSFSVNPKTDSTTNEVSKYRFEQQVPEKYTEVSHTDPVLDSGTISCGSWKKYTPCNSLDIPVSELSESIIVGKLTGKYADMPTAVVWTSKALTEEECSQIRASIGNINGIGNPKNVEFYSGDNVSVPQYGLSICMSDKKVLMDKPDCWALFAGAEYNKVFYQISPGLIKNSVLRMPSAPDEPSVPDEPLTPDEPSTPDEPAIPDEPSTPDEPLTPDEPPVPIDPNDTDQPQDVNSDSPDSSVSETTNSVSGEPQTGDSENITLCLALAALAALTSTALLTIKRKVK